MREGYAPRVVVLKEIVSRRSARRMARPVEIIQAQKGTLKGRPLLCWGGGRSDESDIVFAHGVVECENVLRNRVAPLGKLSFEPLIEVFKDRLFGSRGRGVRAVGYGLQIGEFAFELRWVVREVLGGLAIHLNQFFLDGADFLAQIRGRRDQP